MMDHNVHIANVVTVDLLMQMICMFVRWLLCLYVALLYMLNLLLYIHITHIDKIVYHCWQILHIC